MHPDKPDKPDDLIRNKLFTSDGKPLRILSTSLGIALLANVAFLPHASHAAPDAASTASTTASPTLVEWSNEAVKAYYDPAVDWNLPLPPEKELDQSELDQGAASGAGASSGGASGGTTIINTTSSGFGWDDLMLYHLLFNSGGPYSAQSWSSSHRSYYYGSHAPYQPRTRTAGVYQNKPVAGSTIKPKTSNTTGSITRRTTSSKPGGIGGKSSSMSSSSSSGSHASSSSSHASSSGFGG
ncbi:hypothetical protein [Paenibacillus sacheonensis]|uniref:Uncharacterized protein n=1 Tax=Paenibacillus sacheonensis TaxID=742054 RepID=A0A7X4YTY4_9BACL|nr:hypothetical protein [Paenibacillus sacheonensis]MBM7568602.1 hypothetical protein [Paenibacillus sacheonensis]NBC72502.1 hypothetical protein [Paenibacillus sacheonensis]